MSVYTYLPLVPFFLIIFLVLALAYVEDNKIDTKSKRGARKTLLVGTIAVLAAVLWPFTLIGFVCYASLAALIGTYRLVRRAI